jgi:hypothetical protein
MDSYRFVGTGEPPGSNNRGDALTTPWGWGPECEHEDSDKRMAEEDGCDKDEKD